MIEIFAALYLVTSLIYGICSIRFQRIFSKDASVVQDALSFVLNVVLFPIAMPWAMANLHAYVKQKEFVK
jgi:hypothetical protein